MTFPTADYIRIKEWNTFDTYKPELVTYYMLDILSRCETEQEAESLKQQILSEHEIVERLKKSKIKIHNIYGKDKPDYYNGFRLMIEIDKTGKEELEKLLKSILGDKK